MLESLLILCLAAAPVFPEPAATSDRDSSADSLVQSVAAETPGFRLEREPVAGGAEVVTIFGRLQDPASGDERLDVPLVSVLRDTLGESSAENHRLRYVWILTSTRPTPLQRFASAVSFFRYRAGGKLHANRVPAPALDLASPGKQVWGNLFAKGLQATQLDPLGVMVRVSTRSYRGDSSDYRKVHLFQALGALDSLERSKDSEDVLPDSELREIYSRLSLSDRTLGGLVGREKLSTYYDKETSRREQNLGRNWELLRQRAELAGLYFDPLALPDSSPTQALLWVAREDLEHPANRRYERQFLNIANPWTDERLRQWSGYSQTRYLDAGNRPVPAGTPGARSVEMIPLALYSLDHPHVPLLLADFRDNFKPKRSELVRHGASTVLTGVFRFTRFGSWPFFVGDSAWTFIRGRHGVAVNRTARLRAYAEARDFLAADTVMDGRLRTELLARLDHLALNPLENSVATEATVAKEQYAALLQYAESRKGLIAKLDRDRRKEFDSYTKSGFRRLLAGIGHLFTGAPPVNPDDTAFHVQLAAYRRTGQQVRFLEQLLESSPRPEVVWNSEEIRKTIEALSAATRSQPRVAQLIARVFTRSSDSELRFACLRSLQHLDVEQAHNELWRLSQDPATDGSWRAICLLYFNGDNASGLVAGPGGAQ